MATSEPLRRPTTVPKKGPASEEFGHTVVYQNEVLRHSVHTRLVHWGVALFFMLALFSGFALFTPWLYAWLSPLFGSGARTRLLHPWFGLGFVIFMFFQLRGWLNDMRWKPSDRLWLQRIRAYITHADETEPDYVEKFNAGQKMWFWTMVASGAVFLITGIPLWFPEYLGRTLMWICYFFHDLTGLVMLGGFFIHIYEGTAALPGTFTGSAGGS